VTRKVPFENASSFAIPLAVTKGERPPIVEKDFSKEYSALVKR
jgi:hypothetical protein